MATLVSGRVYLSPLGHPGTPEERQDCSFAHSLDELRATDKWGVPQPSSRPAMRSGHLTNRPIGPQKVAF